MNEANAAEVVALATQPLRKRLVIANVLRLEDIALASPQKAQTHLSVRQREVAYA